MHDIKFIRNHPQEFEKLMSRRGVEVESSEILEFDTKIRFHQTEIQVVQEKRNKISKEIGKLVSQGSDISDLKQTVENFKSNLSLLDEKIKKLSKQLNSILIELPNFLDQDVPDGKTDIENELIKEWGVIPKFSFEP